MKIKKDTKYYRNLVYLKILKIPLNSIIDNKIIKLNCLNCKKEVEAFIGSSLG